MSIFNELLPKINEISIAYTKNFNDDLKAITECFDKFEAEVQNGRGKAREKGQKDNTLVTTLQSIHEDADETNKSPDGKPKRTSSGKSGTESRSSSESNSERRLSNKRNKNEVDGLVSPEQDKRQKRNASVKAQSIISKQVNVNLTQKMRREEPEKSRGRRRKEDDKENEADFANIQIKEEKVSLPPEPMDTESLPVNIEVKKEVDKDDIAMPPPAAPVPKPRKGAAKEKERSDDNEEETTRRSRRNTKTRKQTDTMPPPAAPVAAPRTRSSRASSRKQTDIDDVPAPIPTETRPKRTRAKKKASETPPSDTDKDSTQNSATATPEKPRPKRTRRGQKAAEKEQPKPEEPKPEEPEPETDPEPVLKEEPVSAPQSPILPQKVAQKENKKKDARSKIPVSDKRDTPEAKAVEPEPASELDETRVLHKADPTATPDMDSTVVLPSGVYSHAPDTPDNVIMNSTVVIDTCNRETIVLDKQHAIMDCTVVIDKAPVPKDVNISEDNSILTDDNSEVIDHTPSKAIPAQQPTSAVKEKVQQFEELASRVTRTKTRAMAKKEDGPENQTPPDKVSKVILSAETLSKMNSLIFNGKPAQISSSASKPRTNVSVSVKTVPASASKISAINRAREEDNLKKEKEDARKKKEALLEAKREQQRRKREDKMAAAAAARSAADRERLAARAAAARERLEKQAHADLGKLERVREAERKKLENARKAAEIEERRRLEELRLKQRLDDELRREAARQKQMEEAEATKKEAALMAKEIEKRQKEYLEKHRIKQKMEDRMHKTPLKLGTPGAHYPPLEPVYMADGFQYLNSDEEEDAVERPAPAWSTFKARKAQLSIQTRLAPTHVDRLFSVRVHSPDLREIFPGIERSRLKRTSSAVWRTPPPRLQPLAE